eukprot:jgi/Chlat1/9287/Chrsp99S08546
MARRRFPASQLSSHTPAPDSARRRRQVSQEDPPHPPPQPPHPAPPSPPQPQPRPPPLAHQQQQPQQHLGVEGGGIVVGGFRAGVVREVLASLRARRGVTAAYGMEEQAKEEEEIYKDTPRLVVDPTPDWRGLRVLPPSLPLRFHFPYSCPHCDEVLPVKSALDSFAYSVPGLTLKPSYINKQQANINTANKPQQAEAQSSSSSHQQQERDNTLHAEESETTQPSKTQQQQQQRDTTAGVSVREVACQTVVDAGTQTEGGEEEDQQVGLRHVGIDDAVRLRKGEKRRHVAQRPGSAPEMTRPAQAGE